MWRGDLHDSLCPLPQASLQSRKIRGSNVTSADSLLSASAGGLLGSLFQESPSQRAPWVPPCPAAPMSQEKWNSLGPGQPLGCTWPPVPRMLPAQPSWLTAAHLVLALGQARPGLAGWGSARNRPRGGAKPRPHPRCCSGLKEPPTCTAARATHPAMEGRCQCARRQNWACSNPGSAGG